MKLENNREVEAFQALKSKKSEKGAIQYLVSRGTPEIVAKKDVRRVRGKLTRSNRFSGFGKMVVGGGGLVCCFVVIQSTGYLFYVIATIAGLSFLGGLYQFLFPTSYNVDT